ncbi:MAG: hypothetical protein QOG67_3616 [Verrucomicrobiota bacterium]|jgi:hypothetical protein
MNTNCVSKILAVIAVAAAAAVATPTAFAVPGYILTLTEVSSTVLTYTYTNPTDPTAFTITPGIRGGTSPDTWTISFDPMSGIALSSAVYDFAEAAGEPSNEVNRYFYATGIGSDFAFFVNSDLPLGTGSTVTSANIGTDGGIPIFLQFVDSAFASETASNGVPEGGSSLGLLALALAALVGLTRLRRLCPSSVDS